MGRRLDVDNLVGASEIAARLGLRRATTVNQWTRRHRSFPRPVKVLRAGGIWDWRAVERWARATNRLDA